MGSEGRGREDAAGEGVDGIVASEMGFVEEVVAREVGSIVDGLSEGDVVIEVWGG